MSRPSCTHLRVTKGLNGAAYISCYSFPSHSHICMTLQSKTTEQSKAMDEELRYIQGDQSKDAMKTQTPEEEHCTIDRNSD